jgi:Peptidase family M23
MILLARSEVNPAPTAGGEPAPSAPADGGERRTLAAVRSDVRRPIGAALIVATVLALVPATGSAPASAERPPRRALEGCFRPDPPRSFRRQVVRAIRISRDLPIAWADAPELAKIVCWQGSGFRTDFRRDGRSYYVWRGLFAMTVQEMETIEGTWMTARRDAFRLSPACFKWGWDACRHTIANTAWSQQLIAGLRWIWLNHGTPSAAWRHIKRTGRFNSFPRPGTYDRPTRDPFQRCPVTGPVYYRDSFGDRRTVGGYHPHWGTDVVASAGRPIVAPFDGYAIAHRDGWFAGLWVTVLGRRGYVRNVHLSRFGKLGEVRTGDVVGYVGATGDARGPHDHLEWHPWAAPFPRHRSPAGYDLIMDAIDPYPFLNRACRAGRVAEPPRRVDGPLEA